MVTDPSRNQAIAPRPTPGPAIYRDKMPVPNKEPNDNAGRNKFIIIVIAIGLAIVAAVLIFNAIHTAADEAGYKGRIEQLTSDNADIERRWVVDASNLPYDVKNARETHEIEQFYIAWSPEVRVRCYDDGASYDMVVKNNPSENNIKRDEMMFPVFADQYEQLVLRKDANTIRKTRYLFYEEGQIITIDVFHGSLDNFALASVDFANEKEAEEFKPLNWMTQEVTADTRYLNASLARWGIPDEIGSSE